MTFPEEVKDHMDDITYIDDATLERIGYACVRDQWCLLLRRHMCLSRNALADLMGVTNVTLKRWEEGAGRPWSTSAKKLGLFYLNSLVSFEKLFNLNLQPCDLVLLSHVPGLLGVTSLTEDIPEDMTIDLGVLGIWVAHADIQKLRP